VVEVCCSDFLCVGMLGAFVGFWLGAIRILCQFLYCSSVVCL
jgi:hypothetical protein